MLGDRRRMMAPKSEFVYGNFGGYMFTPGPLVYEYGQFRVQGSWNEKNSRTSKYGVTEGSTYFNFIQLGQRFDSRGSSFSNSSGNIDNSNPTSFDKYCDWKIPTRDALRKLIGTIYGYTRTGATVNGYSKKHYCRISTNITYAGVSNMGGYLFFPDNQVITGRTLSYFDSTTLAASNVTSEELNSFIKKGCLFFPLMGSCYLGNWYNEGAAGFVWSNTQRYNSNAYCIQFSDSSIDVDNTYNKPEAYFLTFLCRTI